MAKIFGHQWYEGTIITYCHANRNYGIYWEDGDSEVGDLSVTLRRIEDWYVKTESALGLSFELRDHPLTTCELSPELQQCLGTALDKILLMCETFSVGRTRYTFSVISLASSPNCCLHTELVTRRSAEQSTPLIRANGKTYGNRPSRQEKEPKTAQPKTHA